MDFDSLGEKLPGILISVFVFILLRFVGCSGQMASFGSEAAGAVYESAATHSEPTRDENSNYEPEDNEDDTYYYENEDDCEHSYQSYCCYCDGECSYYEEESYDNCTCDDEY